MFGWLTAIGSAVGAFFGFKGAQGKVLESAMDGLKEVSKADAAYFVAAQGAIEAVYTHGTPFERTWRPLAMYIFLGLIVARFFGYVPVGLTPEEVERIYLFFEIGLIGYMPLRSLDKWMKGFQIGAILKAFISKRIL